MAQKTDTSQVDRFKQLAKELGCNEDEAAFEEALRKVAQSKPQPKHVPQKRAPKKD